MMRLSDNSPFGSIWCFFCHRHSIWDTMKGQDKERNCGDIFHNRTITARQYFCITKNFCTQIVCSDFWELHLRCSCWNKFGSEIMTVVFSELPEILALFLLILFFSSSSGVERTSQDLTRRFSYLVIAENHIQIAKNWWEFIIVHLHTSKEVFWHWPRCDAKVRQTPRPNKCILHVRHFNQSKVAWGFWFEFFCIWDPYILSSAHTPKSRLGSRPSLSLVISTLFQRQQASHVTCPDVEVTRCKNEFTKEPIWGATAKSRSGDKS